MKEKNKRGDNIAITQLIIIIIAVIFLFIALAIVFNAKAKGVSIIDSIKNILVFGA